MLKAVGMAHLALGASLDRCAFLPPHRVGPAGRSDLAPWRCGNEACKVTDIGRRDEGQPIEAGFELLDKIHALPGGELEGILEDGVSGTHEAILISTELQGQGKGSKSSRRVLIPWYLDPAMETMAFVGGHDFDLFVSYARDDRLRVLRPEARSSGSVVEMLKSLLGLLEDLLGNP